MTDFATELGLWPSDYARQIEWINRLKLNLQTLNDFVHQNIGLVVLLEQTTEPTQLEWETGWTTQTGEPLPIPPSADLYWWDTSENKFGGVYGTIIGSTSVYRRQHLYPINSVILFKQDYKTDKISGITYSIGTNLASYPSITFTLPAKADLELNASLYVRLTAGTGNWGVDFLLNGVKVGTQYYGVPTNHGLQNAAASGLLNGRAEISDCPPGVYTAQMIFGVTNSPASPPTLEIGGISGANSFGARQLFVKGFARA